MRNEHKHLNKHLEKHTPASLWPPLLPPHWSPVPSLYITVSPLGEVMLVQEAEVGVQWLLCFCRSLLLTQLLGCGLLHRLQSPQKCTSSHISLLSLLRHLFAPALAGCLYPAPAQESLFSSCAQVPLCSWAVRVSSFSSVTLFPIVVTSLSETRFHRGTMCSPIGTVWHVVVGPFCPLQSQLGPAQGSPRPHPAQVALDPHIHHRHLPAVASAAGKCQKKGASQSTREHTASWSNIQVHLTRSSSLREKLYVSKTV